MTNDYIVIEPADQTIPNIQFAELMNAVLQKGKPFRFKAAGFSMSPFISDGDILTITPLERVIRIGQILAIYDGQKHLYIHRVIKIDDDKYLLKGDNSLTPDGWVTRNEILGFVTTVIHKSGHRQIGLGAERGLIAFCSKIGVLIPVVSILIRLRHFFKIEAPNG